MGTDVENDHGAEPEKPAPENDKNPKTVESSNLLGLSPSNITAILTGAAAVLVALPLITTLVTSTTTKFLHDNFQEDVRIMTKLNTKNEIALTNLQETLKEKEQDVAGLTKDVDDAKVRLEKLDKLLKLNEELGDDKIAELNLIMNWYQQSLEEQAEIASPLDLIALQIGVDTTRDQFSEIAARLDNLRLSCRVPSESINASGYAQVQCGANEVLTGGGIRNRHRKLDDESIFEEAFPIKDINAFQCDMGHGGGNYVCYAVCCSLG